MKLLKIKNKFYKLVQCINKKNALEETWLTDFGDKIYLIDDNFYSFDGIIFNDCEVIPIEDWVINMFFKVKGH